MSSPSLLSSPSNSEDHDANSDRVPPSSTTSSIPQSMIDSLRRLRATSDVFPFLPVSNAARMTLNICKMLSVRVTVFIPLPKRAPLGSRYRPCRTSYPIKSRLERISVQISAKCSGAHFVPSQHIVPSNPPSSARDSAIRSIHTLARKLSRRGFFKSIGFSRSSNDSLVELLQHQATLGVAKLKFQFKAALNETERSNASYHSGSTSSSDSSRPSSTNTTNSGSGTASNVYGVQNISITMHNYHAVFAYEV
ncbi:hypothetical protein ONZ45_g13311 [Pleurotus djamor]|nr:hypothetical protein ONZ45_g13311 [Pleurotus djamor]